MTKTKQRKLKQSEVIKLSKWIESRKESLESEPTTIADLASKASTDLGFSVSGSSIRAIAEAVEVKISTKAAGGGISGFSKDELASMRDRIANLERVVCDLAERFPKLEFRIDEVDAFLERRSNEALERIRDLEERLKQLDSVGASGELFPAN